MAVYSFVVTSPNQWSEHRFLMFGKWGPFCPTSGNYPPSGWGLGWIAAIVARTEINLSFPCIPLEVANLQENPEFQNSYIRQRFPVQLLFMLGDRFLMLSIVASSLIFTAFFLKWLVYFQLKSPKIYNLDLWKPGFKKSRLYMYMSEIQMSQKCVASPFHPTPYF